MGLRVPVRDFLTALCADRLALLLGMLAGKEDPPYLFSDAMLAPREPETTGRFASGAEFEAWWNGEQSDSEEE